MFIPKMIGNGTKGGYNYIIMDYLEESIDDYLKRNKYQTDTFIQVSTEMVLSIKELHSFGYIHRDITPQKFRVTNNHVKVFNFRISRKFNEDERDPETGKKVHKTLKRGTFEGNLLYVSLATHEGWY